MFAAYEVGVATFEGSEAAERVVESLRQRGAVGVSNEVAIVEHHPSGRFSIHAYTAEHTRGRKAGEGAVIGALGGALLFGPFGLVAGLIGGAAVGASAGGADPHDLGLSDDFVDRLKSALPPDSSAVVIVGEPEGVGELMGDIRSADVVTRTELHQPLSDAQVAAVRAALERQG
jgi:uncharacterized membrane protein